MQKLSPAQLDILARIVTDGKAEYPIHQRLSGRVDPRAKLVDAGLIKATEVPTKGIVRFTPTGAGTKAYKDATA